MGKSMKSIPKKVWRTVLLEQEEALPEPPDMDDSADAGGDMDLGDEGPDLEGGDELGDAGLEGGDADLGDEGADDLGGDDLGGMDFGGSGGFGGGMDFGGGGDDFGGGDDAGGDDAETEAPAEPEEPADPVEHAVEEAKKLASGNQNIQQILTVMKSIITDRTVDAQQLSSIVQQLKAEDDLVLSAVANRLEIFTKGI